MIFTNRDRDSEGIRPIAAGELGWVGHSEVGVGVEVGVCVKVSSEIVVYLSSLSKILGVCPKTSQMLPFTRKRIKIRKRTTSAAVKSLG